MFIDGHVARLVYGPAGGLDPAVSGADGDKHHLEAGSAANRLIQGIPKVEGVLGATAEGDDELIMGWLAATSR